MTESITFSIHEYIISLHFINVNIIIIISILLIFLINVIIL